MDNPLVTWFIIGFLIGFMFGTYMGNKKFRQFVNKMIKGKPHDEDEGDDDEELTQQDYEKRNRHYRDGRYRQ